MVGHWSAGWSQHEENLLRQFVSLGLISVSISNESYLCRLLTKFALNPNLSEELKLLQYSQGINF